MKDDWKEVVYVTGNADKATYFSNATGLRLPHRRVDLAEIQSRDLGEIVMDKAERAHAILGLPVLVEDVGLEIGAFGGLPGPFVKWFLEAMSLDQICDLVPADNRSARAVCSIALYNGTRSRVFEGELLGQIATKPRGNSGFGWDPIFIPSGFDVPRAALSEQEDRKTYLSLKPFLMASKFIKGQMD
ncbi:MAG: non-canonical purine NTP pyrophosphatase [Pseudomonadota bacterium]